MARVPARVFFLAVMEMRGALLGKQAVCLASQLQQFRSFLLRFILCGRFRSEWIFPNSDRQDERMGNESEYIAQYIQRQMDPHS